MVAFHIFVVMELQHAQVGLLQAKKSAENKKGRK